MYFSRRVEYFCVSVYIPTYKFISDCGRFKIKSNNTAAKPKVESDGGKCTLTYISDRFLITAAHCLFEL